MSDEEATTTEEPRAQAMAMRAGAKKKAAGKKKGAAKKAGRKKGGGRRKAAPMESMPAGSSDSMS